MFTHGATLAATEALLSRLISLNCPLK